MAEWRLDQSTMRSSGSAAGIFVTVSGLRCPMDEDDKLPDPGWAVLHDAALGKWLRFRAPQRVVVAHRTQDVRAALERVQEAVENEGLAAAGFVAYEASPGLDSALKCRPPDDFPLVWFGLCSLPEPLSEPFSFSIDTADVLEIWRPSMDIGTYARAVRRIRDMIREGETYQVNLTYRLSRKFLSDPKALFSRLCAAQRPAYGAYIDIGDWVVASASPELFFRQHAERVECRPMKGTAKRGLDLTGDRQRARSLLASEKDRAENLMIVDMVRNDLGRIARHGSVRVPKLFDLEKYPGVWQLTSTVQATTSAFPMHVLSAMFPAASITGAPKARTMQIIAELETTPRRVYTGTVGFLLPGRRAQFNVAIRTALVDRRRARVEFGTGGGIVWDSVPEAELQESRVKACILTTPTAAGFSLIETLRWTPAEGYFLLDLHFKRLRDSAEYFDFRFDEAKLRARLAALATGLGRGLYRIRVLLDRSGSVSIEAGSLEQHAPRPRRVALASHAVKRDDPFLYHKTTFRRTYESARFTAPEADDVILFNEDREVTESCVANLVVELEGALWTPPTRCGLLAGTYRSRLLDLGAVRERVVTIDELVGSSCLWLVNSVRGIMPARLADPPT